MPHRYIYNLIQTVSELYVGTLVNINFNKNNIFQNYVCMFVVGGWY